MSCASSRIRRRTRIALVGLLTAIADAPSALAGDPAVTATGEMSFYQDSDNVTVVSPSVAGSVRDASSGWTAGGSYLVDVVSAASVDIVSTASDRWTEIRHAGALSVDLQRGDLGASLGASVSSEPDYLSWYAGGALRLLLDEKHITPSLAYSYSQDTAGRTGTSFDVYSLSLRRHTAQLGAEFILNRSARLTIVGEGVFETGRQEKPYRFLAMFNRENVGAVGRAATPALVNRLRLPGRVAERYPTDRQRYSVAGDLAWRADDRTLRAFQRLYADSWGQRASTTDIRYIVPIVRRLDMWPHVRAHVQSAADFYERTYVADFGADSTSVPEFRTGDREHGGLFTGTLGLGAMFRTSEVVRSGWAFTAQVEVGQTSYFNALYISRRSSYLTTLVAETYF